MSAIPDQRTKTGHLKIFRRPNITYDLSIRDIVTITLPGGSDWSSGLHWHETHTEYLEVLQGSILVTLGSTTHEHKSTDGIITVPRFARHEWKRGPNCPRDEEIVVKEWTDPADGMKEGFFRNLNSVILESPPASSSQSLLSTYWAEALMTMQLFLIFRDWDNWPVLWSLDEWAVVRYTLTWLVTHLTLLVTSTLARFVGLRSQYPEYMPKPAT